MLTLNVYQIDDRQEFYWVMLGKNTKAVCKSITTFKTKTAARVSADNFERNCLRFDVKKNYIS